MTWPSGPRQAGHVRPTEDQRPVSPRSGRVVRPFRLWLRVQWPPPGLRFPFAPCKPRVPTNGNLPDCPWWVPRGPTKPRAPGTGWAAQRPHLGAGGEPLPVESPAPSVQLPSPVCRCELGWGRRCTSRCVGGGGSRGKHGLPAISFSKNGWMSCPYLEFPATASFSSCPQQTGGENAGKTPLNFQKAGG